MRKIRTAVLAGVVGLVAVGTAMAASHDKHLLNIAMPDGSIAKIEYQGDVAPRVMVTPAETVAVPIALFEPFAVSAFDTEPFAALDRMAAQMDREMNAVIRQAAALQQAQPLSPDGKLDMAAFGKMPAGTIHYSFVSTSSGNGTCNRTVQMTYYGQGQQPKILQTSSGDCKGMPDVTPAAASATAKIQPVKDEAKPATTHAPSTI